MKSSDPLQLLLSGQSVTLGSWIAEPVPGQYAAACLAGIQHKLQSSLVDRYSDFPLRLAELVMHYWCGQDVEPLFRNMLVLHRAQREQAQLKLGYGQLLMARKHAPARDYLDSGFELAAHLLEPEEYFLVLKRHALLGQLQLLPTPSAPDSLAALLTEAKVIRRLNGRANTALLKQNRHQDTLG